MDLISEIVLRVGTDRQKLQAINRQSSDYDKIRIAKTLSSDELKIQVIEQVNENVSLNDLLKTFKQDEMKVKGINILCKRNSHFFLEDRKLIELFPTDSAKLIAIDQLDEQMIKNKIIELLETDEAKLKVIDKMQVDEEKLDEFARNLNNYAKAEIAITLKSDEAKLQAINKFEDVDFKVKIAKTLQSDQLKLQVIDESENEYFKVEIAKTLQSDQLKLQVIDESENEYFKVEIAKTLQSEQLKLHVIDKLENEYFKVEIAKTLQDERLKMQVLDTLEYNSNKLEIVKTLQSDQLKMQVLDTLEIDRYKVVEIAKTFENDEAKLQVMDKVEGDYFKVEIAKTLTNDKTRLQAIDRIEDIAIKKEIAITLKSDEAKLQVMNGVEGVYLKIELAETFKSEELKLQVKSSLSKAEEASMLYSDEEKKTAMGEIEFEFARVEIAKKLNSDETKLKIMDTFESEYNKMVIAYNIHSYEIMIQAINKIEDDQKALEIIRHIDFPPDVLLSVIGNLNRPGITQSILRWHRQTKKITQEFILEQIDKFIQIECPTIDRKYIKEILMRMYEKNNDVVQNVDFRILDKKYIEQLGEDRVNQITCYPNIQSKILSLNDSQLIIFSKCIDNYLERNQTEEWQVLATQILEHISEYDELLHNFEDMENISPEDIATLSQILSNSNWCNITNIDEVRNFYLIVQNKCNEIMQDENSTRKQKRNAVMQKIFGHDLKYAESILKRFGVDNENLNESEMKDYVRCLQQITQINNPDILKEIFDSCDFVQIDETYIEKSLKQEYCKKYLETLYIPKDKDLETGETNIYNAGTDFNIIMTAIGAYSYTYPTNYRDDWNRPAIASQQICTSYIRNDMIGTAPIRNICYGFSSMQPDSLMLSGKQDMYSSWGDGLVVTADHAEEYYTPDEQINHTTVYNEMNFRRIQNGQKIQPDYIIVFRENGKIPNMAEAKKASEQWGGMPIVIIDKDACLEAERQKVEDMLERYEQNPTPEIARQINQKVRNNRITRENFCEDIQSKITQINSTETEKHEVGIQELEENDSKVTAYERKEETKRIHSVYSKIQEVVKEEENSDGRE